MQDVLGEHQDAVVAAAWLRANALTLGDPAAVYVAGELGAVERAAADDVPGRVAGGVERASGASACGDGCERRRRARG